MASKKSNLANVVTKVAVVFFVVYFLCGPVRSAQCRKLGLVVNGRAKAVIVLPKDASVATAEGIKVFSDHIHQMSGVHLKMVKEKDIREVKIKNGRIVTIPAFARNFVLIGRSSLTGLLGIDTKNLGPGGIVIKTTPNALVLLGYETRKSTDLWDTCFAKKTSHPAIENCANFLKDSLGISYRWHSEWGPSYAVTTFLEDSLGIRYLWPGELGKVVPKRRTITVGPLDMRFTPALKQRKIRTIDYRKLGVGLDKLGITEEEYDRAFTAASATVSATPNWFRWQRLGGNLGLEAGHAFLHLWHKYGKEHPEWFALQPNGSRDQSLKPDRARLCKSNKELLEAIAKEKIEELNNNPGQKSISIGPNDGSRLSFCMCPECKKLDPPQGRKITLWDFTSGKRKGFEYVSLTDRMIYFWNTIAEKVAEVHPDVLFTADAYSFYSAPPVRRKLHPNGVVRFVPISYTSDAKRRQGLADWDAWSAMASKIYWRPNFINEGKREGTPLVYVHKLAEDFRYMAAHKMIGTDFDKCVQNWATQGLVYYAAAKLNWNPDLDIDALIDDYCRSGFGNAAGAVKRYFLRIEELTDMIAAATPGNARSKAVKYTPPYTKKVIKELRGFLNKAKRKAGNDKEAQARIAFLRRGLDFTDLQARAYRLLEKAEKGKRVNKAELRRLLDKRYLMMHDIFHNDHMAVNVAFVSWGEDDRFWKLGWKEPSNKSH